MPRGFAAPQPKQELVGLGLSNIPYLKSLRSNKSHARVRFVARPALSLPELHFERVAEHLYSARDPLFVETRESKPQSIGLRLLRVEISTWNEQNAAFTDMNQKLAGVETRRQRNPDRHATFGTGPGGLLRHVLDERMFESLEAAAIDFFHFHEVPRQMAAADKFRERCLRELVGMQIGRLLHEP